MNTFNVNESVHGTSQRATNTIQQSKLRPLGKIRQVCAGFSFVLQSLSPYWFSYDKTDVTFLTVTSQTCNKTTTCVLIRLSSEMVQRFGLLHIKKNVTLCNDSQLEGNIDILTSALQQSKSCC